MRPIDKIKKGPAVLLVLGIFGLLIFLSYQQKPTRSDSPAPQRLQVAIAGEISPQSEAYQRLYHSLNACMDRYLAETLTEGSWGVVESPTPGSYPLPPEANYLLWADLQFVSLGDTLRFCGAIAQLPGLEVTLEEYSPDLLVGEVWGTLPLTGHGPTISLKSGLFLAEIESLRLG